MSYNPRPIDTSQVDLTNEILKLTEHLAENAHDIWARQRMSEGWTYGPMRDDTTKKRPNLVPYKVLSNSEQEYDRKAAMETIKAVIVLGYRIEKKR